MKLKLAIVLGLIVAACSPAGNDSANTTDATTPAPTTSVAAASPADEELNGEVMAAQSSLATLLVNESGLTLYIFTVDEGDVSACYDDCEANWPVVAADAALGEGVDVTLGSTTRNDGNEQLTVNGRPVYLFAGDQGPGDTNGHGLSDVWFVIGTDGEPLGGLVSTAETTRGTVLVDEGGNTIYIFTVDEGDVSACYDDCEANWPVVAAGSIVGEDLDVTTGFTSRDDGSEQLIINGRPVYRFAGDQAPGDTNGQGVFEVWFVVGPDGEPKAGAIVTSDTSLGTVLVDEGGNTLYIFTADEGDVSVCYDECEANWPIVDSGSATGEGVEVTTGFTVRDDGSEQLTINGRPVYRFAADLDPGDVNGQGVGGVWYVIGVDGEPITG